MSDPRKPSLTDTELTALHQLGYDWFGPENYDSNIAEAYRTGYHNGSSSVTATIDPMSLQPERADHHPHRGSAVETYIKHWRDSFKKNSSTWRWLDLMLDDYRLRADHGHNLTDSTEGLR